MDYWYRQVSGSWTSDVDTVTSSLSVSVEVSADVWVSVCNKPQLVCRVNKHLCWKAAPSEPPALVQLQPPGRPSSFDLAPGRPASSFLYWDTPGSRPPAEYWGQLRLQRRLSEKANTNSKHCFSAQSRTAAKCASDQTLPVLCHKRRTDQSYQSSFAPKAATLQLLLLESCDDRHLDQILHAWKDIRRSSQDCIWLCWTFPAFMWGGVCSRTGNKRNNHPPWLFICNKRRVAEQANQPAVFHFLPATHPQPAMTNKPGETLTSSNLFTSTSESATKPAHNKCDLSQAHLWGNTESPD